MLRFVPKPEMQRLATVPLGFSLTGFNGLAKTAPTNTRLASLSAIDVGPGMAEVSLALAQDLHQSHVLLPRFGWNKMRTGPNPNVQMFVTAWNTTLGAADLHFDFIAED